MLIDLQLHSTYSDGYLTPEQLAKLMHDQGVKIAALTDHNTVRGVHQFKHACEKYGIWAIPGIEIYVKLNHHKFNVLWYNLDHSATELHEVLRSSQIKRRGQMRTILEHIKERGLAVDVNAIIDKYNHYAPINHIIDDICSVPGNLNKIKKIFNGRGWREGDIINEFFQNSKVPPVLRNSYIDLNRILKLRKKIGGQIVICHPGKGRIFKHDFWIRLQKLGIDGLEALSPHHSYEAVMHLQDIAKHNGFITTGGSDFHRFEGNNMTIQKSWDYLHIDSKLLPGVEKVIGKK